MATSSLTAPEQELLDSWLRFGAGHAVRKLGRGWVIECGSLSHPSVFRTRYEAVSALSRWVAILADRAAGGTGYRLENRP